MAQITLNASGVASNGTLALQSNGTTTAVTINASQGVEFNAGTAAAPTITATGDTNTGIYFPAADQVAITTGGTQRAVVDASGNVGVGATPSAWGSTAKAVQLPNGCAIANLGAGDVVVTQNAYFDNPNFKYASTTGVGSSAYRQIDGTHRWSYSASGTAGNNITFTEAMRIDSSGKLLVGRTSSLGYGEKLAVNGDIATNGTQLNMVPGADFEFVQRSAFKMLFYVNAATVVANLSITGVWTNASDARYKENITDSPYGLAAVMALKPRAYNLINLTDKPQIGFIAQEVLEVVPEVVESVHNSVTDEDRYTLSYGNMVAVLTKAIQEQQAIITTLTDRITALEQA